MRVVAKLRLAAAKEVENHGRNESLCAFRVGLLDFRYWAVSTRAMSVLFHYRRSSFEFGNNPGNLGVCLAETENRVWMNYVRCGVRLSFAWFQCLGFSDCR